MLRGYARFMCFVASLVRTDASFGWLSGSMLLMSGLRASTCIFVQYDSLRTTALVEYTSTPVRTWPYKASRQTRGCETWRLSASCITRETPLTVHMYSHAQFCDFSFHILTRTFFNSLPQDIENGPIFFLVLVAILKETKYRFCL